MEVKARIAGVAIGLAVSVGAASADTLTAYDFSGALATSYSGGADSVDGAFVLDQTNGTLGPYLLSTPLGSFNNSNSSGSVFQYTPALTPDENFVELVFASNSFNILTLVFQTDLATFSASSFYSNMVTVPGGDFGSGLYNGISPALTPNASFTSAAATSFDPVKTYDFLGTLAMSYGGNNSVSGRFTLDPLNETLTQYFVFDPARRF